MPDAREPTPQSVSVILVASLLTGLLFAGIVVEVAYRASNGLTPEQQEGLSDSFWAAEGRYAATHSFHEQEERWPRDLQELATFGVETERMLDGFGRPLRYRVDRWGPVYTSDGIDRQAGGVGLDIDLVFRFTPGPGPETDWTSLGTSRWEYLRRTGPDTLFGSAGGVFLVVGTILFTGLLYDREHGGPRRKTTTAAGCVYLAMKAYLWLFVLGTAAFLVGVLMLGPHLYLGRH